MEDPGEKLSEQRRESTTNSLHNYDTVSGIRTRATYLNKWMDGRTGGWMENYQKS